MLRKSARIPVEDDGLGSDLHYIIDGPVSAGHVHKLYIGLSLGCRVAEGAYPHGIELPRSAPLVYHGILGDKSRKSAVCFYGCDRLLHAEELFQPAPSEVGKRQLCPCSLVKLSVLLVIGVWVLHQSAAVAAEELFHLVTDGLLEALCPVITVYHYIGTVFQYILPVAQLSLLHSPFNSLDIGEHGPALLKGQQRIALVACYGFIGKHSNG